eukprot:TRINITY_DN29446_c0_g1_i1.p1 TRINITY_DN29446_c0_g1~~TRINITY_DN29446_c0_g1_i1.p1  ORF type:complete len:252 (+),score=22.23 TRINITY_DN29446_c0_g1_i1:130-885(+)
MTQAKNVSLGIIRVTKAFNENIQKVVVQDEKINTIYNPLEYAWEPYENYLRKYCGDYKKTIFVGMNPGYFGMVQTGIPFGDLNMVCNFLHLQKFQVPVKQHNIRKIVGYEIKRSEVSGQRFWGLIQTKFGHPDKFFNEDSNFVVNLCPLAFLSETGKNVTPEEISIQEKDKIIVVCMAYFKQIVKFLQIQNIVCIGNFVCKEVKKSLTQDGYYNIVYMQHPSPRVQPQELQWRDVVTKQLEDAGVWQKQYF